MEEWSPMQSPTSELRVEQDLISYELWRFVDG